MFDFFEKLEVSAPSKSAFSQRRKLIKSHFFEDLFRYTSEVFYHRFPAKTWRGHRLIGVDGTGLRIPNEWWLGEHVGWHQNQHHGDIIIPTSANSTT